ncbi:hypothetical protein L9F63_017928, partial [Diploptera punctata]
YFIIWNGQNIMKLKLSRYKLITKTNYNKVCVSTYTTYMLLLELISITMSSFSLSVSR